MNPWDTYFSRINTTGKSRRDELIIREQHRLTEKYKNSISLKNVKIDNIDRRIVIVSSDSFDKKTIHTLPGEEFHQGEMVSWNSEYWIITQVDTEAELYYRGVMLRCNYLLKWISDTGDVVEQWCVVDQANDSFSNGEKNGSGFDINIGDANALLIISSNDNTTKFDRTTRFLIDSYDSKDVLAYRVVNPFRLFGGTNKSGVIYLSLSECNIEATDNVDLHIANYYKFFGEDTSPDRNEDEITDNKKVWF